MAKQQREKLTIKINRRRDLPPADDDKVDKLRALPLSATPVASEPVPTAQVEILDGTLQHAESLQAQEFHCNMIGHTDSAESSCSGTAFINLNPMSFRTLCGRKQPECGSISRSEDESLLQKSSKKFTATHAVNQRTKAAQREPKQRKKTKVQADLSAEEDCSTIDAPVDEPRLFTVYVQVWATSPDSRKPGGKSTKVSVTKITSKGPFKCDTTSAFFSFKSRVAKALSCRVSALPVSKFEWKFENQAQGAPRKKVADEAGYEALIDAVKAKRRHENVVVWLYTPVPKKDEEVWPPWMNH
ncbi:hypothetical protein F5J12DRAFT_942885 [Pisolithus orientalis]|uniref:uncharacterized protein n=1 Tax=Pisolithus orientalis TaxID=936130 RepID=UPI0022243DBC|nr:uncharacterized protein F5J12DRAFT_942885 [Pisolithus orientalis]KAI6004546.1 hypothetical protein F5J12DRAFT_942885 [Pisolithus orientalis]